MEKLVILRNQFSFYHYVPNLSIIIQFMLIIVRYAVIAGQDQERPSKTALAANRPKSEPPYSSEEYIPANPIPSSSDFSRTS